MLSLSSYEESGFTDGVLYQHQHPIPLPEDVSVDYDRTFSIGSYLFNLSYDGEFYELPVMEGNTRRLSPSVFPSFFSQPSDVKTFSVKKLVAAVTSQSDKDILVHFLLSLMVQFDFDLVKALSTVTAQKLIKLGWRPSFVPLSFRSHKAVTSFPLEINKRHHTVKYVDDHSFVAKYRLTPYLRFPIMEGGVSSSLSSSLYAPTGVPAASESVMHATCKAADLMDKLQVELDSAKIGETSADLKNLIKTCKEAIEGLGQKTEKFVTEDMASKIDEIALSATKTLNGVRSHPFFSVTNFQDSVMNGLNSIMSLMSSLSTTNPYVLGIFKAVLTMGIAVLMQYVFNCLGLPDTVRSLCFVIFGVMVGWHRVVMNVVNLAMQYIRTRNHSATWLFKISRAFFDAIRVIVFGDNEDDGEYIDPDKPIIESLSDDFRRFSDAFHKDIGRMKDVDALINFIVKRWGDLSRFFLAPKSILVDFLPASDFASIIEIQDRLTKDWSNSDLINSSKMNEFKTNRFHDDMKYVSSLVTKFCMKSEKPAWKILRGLLTSHEHVAALIGPDAREKTGVLPFVIALGGVPGVGKSVLTNALAQLTYHFLAPDEEIPEPSRLIFQKARSSDYYEGYIGQHAMLMDDFGAIVDSAASPNTDYVSLLDLVSANKVPLDMAFSQKGTSFARSALLLITYNNWTPPVSMTNPEALDRRVHVRVEMEFRTPDEEDQYNFQEIKYRGKNCWIPLSSCPEVLRQKYATFLFVGEHSDALFSPGRTVSQMRGSRISFDDFFNVMLDSFAAHRDNRKRRTNADQLRADYIRAKVDHFSSGAARREVQVLNKVAAVDLESARAEAQRLDSPGGRYKKRNKASNLIPGKKVTQSGDDITVVPNSPRPKKAKQLPATPNKIPLLDVGNMDLFEYVPDPVKYRARMLIEDERGEDEDDLENPVLEETDPEGVPHDDETETVPDPEPVDDPLVPSHVIDLDDAANVLKNAALDAREKTLYNSILEEERTKRRNRIAAVVTFGAVVGLAGALYMLGSWYACRDNDAEKIALQKTNDTLKAQLEGFTGSGAERENPAGERQIRAGKDPVSSSKHFAWVNDTSCNVHVTPLYGDDRFVECNSDHPRQLRNILQKMAGNMYIVNAIDENGVAHALSSAIFLKSCALYMPDHTWRKMLSYTGDFCLVRAGTPRSEILKQPRYNAHKLFSYASEDTALFDSRVVWMAQCQEHPDVIKHFVTDNDVSLLDRLFAAPLRTLATAVDFEMKATEITNASYIGSTTLYMQDGGKRVASRLISMDNWSQMGDCSTVIFRPNPTKPFVAIHEAGDGMYSYAIPMSQPLLMVLLRGLQKQSCKIVIFKDPDNCELDGAINLEGNFLTLGSVKHIHVNSDSGYVKSDLASTGLFKHHRTPVSRKPRVVDENGEEHFPRENSFRKLLTPDFPYDADVRFKLAMCAQHLFTEALNYSVKNQILTLHESIDGLPNSGLSSIELNSSSGFPMVYSKPLKKDVIKRHSDEQVSTSIDPTVVDRLRLFLRSLLTYDPERAVFIDDDKDELRVPDRKYNPRLYSKCPLDFLLAFRMYFWETNVGLHLGKINNGVAVGTNPYGQDWAYLYSSLVSRLDPLAPREDKGIFAGDYSKFDSTIRREMVMLIGDHVIDKYEQAGQTSEERRIRRCLWATLVHSAHIWHDTMYVWQGGNPSGCPITSELNSMVNLIVVRYAYLCSVGDLQTFQTNVFAVTYGDDLLLSVRQEVREKYTPDNISIHAAELGMILTDAEKREETNFVTITEATFLKRAFTRLGNYHAAPLDKMVLEEMVFYQKKGHDGAQNYRNRVVTALYESVLHGEDYFNDFRSRILTACHKKNKNISGWSLPLDFEVALKTVREWTGNAGASC